MDNNQEVILEELECPICTDYLAIPIKQCEIGHSICEKCVQRLEQCALCQSSFTETRNYTLEAIALKVRYPCVNKDAGCNMKLLCTERDEHERKCNFQTFQVKCQMNRCCFVGDPAALKYHWKAKNTSCNIYGAVNKCRVKIKSESYFVNLVEAFNELFWFKSKMSNNEICFAMQLIGKPESAHNFLYQIEISNIIPNEKKIILTDYCKSSLLTDEDIFKENSCIVVSMLNLAQFVAWDVQKPSINYDMKLFRKNVGKRQNNRYRNSRKLKNQVNRNYKVFHRNRSTDRRQLMSDNEDQEDCCVVI